LPTDHVPQRTTQPAADRRRTSPAAIASGVSNRPKTSAGNLNGRTSSLPCLQS
jgi:hypothetical protein